MTSSRTEDPRATPTTEGWWSDHLAQPEPSAARLARERQDMSPAAADVGFSVEELAEILRRGPHAADEIGAVMRELGLDCEAVRVAHPRELSDMQLVCIRCESKRPCRRAVAGRSIDAELDVICRNARVIRDLLAEWKRGQPATG